MMELQEEPCLGPDQVISVSSLKCWDASSAVQLQMSSGPASDTPISVYSLLRRVADQYPTHPALAVKRGGHWKFWEYAQYFEECRTVAKAFISLGLDRFHGVCIMGFNSPEWVITNFAGMFAGGISAGVYTSNSSDACRYLAADSKAQILVLENEQYVQKFLAVKSLLPHVKAIIQWSGVPSAPGVMSWKELISIGKNESDDALEARLKLQAVNQCCTLIYTSGTTGPPKGVMCSQDNLTWCGLQYAKFKSLIACKECVVSYLPLSHLAGQMTDIYAPMSVACTIYFAQPDALKGSLGKTLVEVQPSGFFGVPRVWEKIHEKMQEAASAAGAPVRMLGAWAKYHGLNHYNAKYEGRQLSMYETFQFGLARKLVLNKVKTAMGLNNAHNLVCAGAPLSVEVMEYFMSLDLPIMEGYGLSESVSIGSLCDDKPGCFKYGSVGKVLSFTAVKLQESVMSSGRRKGEGEIFFKGRNICMGYLNMQDKTNETISDDGWLMTGDLGWIDDEGFLFITGRVKELVITAGGENIPPVIIEDAIKKELPILANAMLVGDRRKYLAILFTIFCEFDDTSGAPLEALAPPVIAWCAQRGLKITTVTEFIKEMETNRQGEAAKAVQAAVDKYNKEDAISNAQKVQRWAFLPHAFTLATGELNNILKLKRSVVADTYADVIDRLYGDDYPKISVNKV